MTFEVLVSIVLAMTFTVAGCGGTVAAPEDASADSALADAIDARDVTTDGGDASACPDWFQVKPGGTCTVAQGTECFANLGVQGGWVRCCNGVWGEPNEAGTGLGAPKCP